MKKNNLKNQSLINKKYKYELLENGFTNQDILIGKKVLSSKRITMASYTRNFEMSFAKKIGAKYALMVNSGSSANLIATFWKFQMCQLYAGQHIWPLDLVLN